MAILTYPLNGITYDAEDVEVYMCTRTSGVFASDGHFPASVSGRTVSIGPGLAWIQNEEFHGKAIYNPDMVDLTISEADPYQDRIDRIVLQFDKLLNQTTLVVKEGTPASSPTAPGIERSELIYELGLYTVTVKASTIAITDANIASTILDDSVCGIMMDAVTQIPTQELYDQWYAWFSQIQTDTETFETQFNLWFEQIKEEAEADMESYNEQFEVWMNGSKVTFDEWFDSVQDTLDSDEAGHLTNLVTDAQDTADEALEQLAKGIVTGFMTDDAEGDSEYALQPDDNDSNYGITISRPICDCADETPIDMISDAFNSSYTYKAGEYCIYEDTLWRFTSDKPAGEWNYSYVQMTNVGTELTSANNNIATNASGIATNATSIQKNTTAIEQNADNINTANNAIDELNSALFYKPNDTISISRLDTSGYVTSSSSSVRFIIPLCKPLDGVSSVSVSLALIIRQGGNYTHGSSANVSVTPSSIKVTFDGGFLNVVAEMSSTTNAINNDSCGIESTNISIIFK